LGGGGTPRDIAILLSSKARREWWVYKS